MYSIASRLPVVVRAGPQPTKEGFLDKRALPPIVGCAGTTSHLWVVSLFILWLRILFVHIFIRKLFIIDSSSMKRVTFNNQIHCIRNSFSCAIVGKHRKASV